jgi:phenylalanyl-tRNA synthetase beta chain
LLPNLAEAALHNRNRNIADVALFELGSVFLTQEEGTLTALPEERRTVAAFLSGAVSETHWSGGKGRLADFYDLKGILEKLLVQLGVSEVTYEAASPAGFHPGRTASIYADGPHGRLLLGRIGALHPELQAQWETGDCYVFELDFSALVEAAAEAGVYEPLPKYPAASRDLAVVVDSAVPAGTLIATIRETAGVALESVQVFDVYTGERLGAGKKSVAIALVYRRAERTMTDEEVAELHARVTEALESRHGAELRK